MMIASARPGRACLVPRDLYPQDPPQSGAVQQIKRAPVRVADHDAATTRPARPVGAEHRRDGRRGQVTDLRDIENDHTRAREHKAAQPPTKLSKPVGECLVGKLHDDLVVHERGRRHGHEILLRADRRWRVKVG